MRNLLSIAILSAILSCTKQANIPYHPVQVCSDISNNVDSINKYIQGRWNWLEEKRWDRISFSFEYITPKTSGYIETIKIKDSTIIFYKNYFIVAKYNFKIIKESDLFPGASDNAFFEFLDTKTGYTTNLVPISACSQFLVFHFEVVSDVAGTVTYKLIN